MIKNNTYKKILTYTFWLIFYGLIFLILLKNSFSYLDPDLGWHLRVGAEIFETQKIPNLQTYMWTLDKATWVDHEWLLNLITYTIFQNFGYIILSIFFTLIPLIGFILLNVHFKKKYLDDPGADIFIIALQVFGVFACLPHFGVRMQEITFLFLIILFIIIDNLEIKQTIRTSIFTIILFYIWACLHAGFLIGLFVLFFKLFVDIVIFIANTKQLDKNIKEQEIRKIKFLGITAIISFLITIVTPYGITLYKFLYDYKNNFYKFHIQEWLSPFIYIPIQYVKLIYICFTIVAIIFILVFEKIHLYKKHIHCMYYWQILLSIVFVYLSISSLRHTPLLIISSFFFLNIFIYKLFRNYYKHINPLVLKIFFIIIILIFSICYLTSIKIIKNPFDNNYCNKYPCGFSNFLNNNPQYKKNIIFNNYNWGGYFIYKHPDIKLFIDGRLPQYPYKDKTILEEYYSFFEKNEISNKLNEYDINMVIFNIKTDIKLDWVEKNILKIDENKINTSKNNLLEYLKNSTDWKTLYEDLNTIVYIKK